MPYALLLRTHNTAMLLMASDEFDFAAKVLVATIGTVHLLIKKQIPLQRKLIAVGNEWNIV